MLNISKVKKWLKSALKNCRYYSSDVDPASFESVDPDPEV